MYRKIMWSLRKLKPFYHRAGLVLDVGSGGRPNPFADVLLEKFDGDTEHRFHKAQFDRPTVIGDAENMPFKENAFSYSVAFHVLEHVASPEMMLRELERVSAAGYIETPNVLHEKLFPYHEHLWNIFSDGSEIHLHWKGADECIDVPFHTSENMAALKRLRVSQPGVFHMQYEWAGSIKFKVHVHPKVPDHLGVESAPKRDGLSQAINRNGLRRKANDAASSLIQGVFQKRAVNLESILCCIVCQSDVELREAFYVCKSEVCAAKYKAHPHPNFLEPC